jgi:hypothetical protein
MKMQPWPPVLVFLWRFLIIPVLITAVLMFIIHDLRFNSPPIIIIFFAIYVNLFFYKLDKLTNKISLLEKEISALKQKNTVSLENG